MYKVPIINKAVSTGPTKTANPVLGRMRLELLLLSLCLLYWAAEARTLHQGRVKTHFHLKNFHPPNRYRNVKKDQEDVNPCEPDTPFLCKTSQKCVALVYVCDGKSDCDDGFDENRAVCNAAKRPAVEDIWQFLLNEGDWMRNSLFDGINPEFVAHTLVVSSSLKEVENVLGLSDKSVKNLRTAFEAVETQDERPLLDLGMPENSWHEIEYMFKKILDSGFEM